MREESLIGSQWKTNVFYLKGRNRGRWRWKNPPAKKRTEKQDPAVCTNRTAMSLFFWVISENCFTWFMANTVFNWTMWPYCDTVSHTGSSLKVMCLSSPRISSSPKHGFILTLTEHDETAVKYQKLYYIKTSKGERKRAVRLTFPADYFKIKVGNIKKQRSFRDSFWPFGFCLFSLFLGKYFSNLWFIFF